MRKRHDQAMKWLEQIERIYCVPINRLKSVQRLVNDMLLFYFKPSGFHLNDFHIGEKNEWK